MKIGLLIGNVGQRIIDGVKESVEIVGAAIFNGYSGMLAKRHGEITVESTVGVDVDGKSLNADPLVPAIAKKIAQRHFDAWDVGTVPIDAQDQVAETFVVDSEPHVLNDSRAIDIHKRNRRFFWHLHPGTNLPSTA